MSLCSLGNSCLSKMERNMWEIDISILA